VLCIIDNFNFTANLKFRKLIPLVTSLNAFIQTSPRFFLCLDDGLINVETFGYFDKTKQLVLIGSYFDCSSSLRSVHKTQQDVSH